MFRPSTLLPAAAACALLVFGSVALVGLVLAGVGGALARSCAVPVVAGGDPARTEAPAWSAEQSANAQTITDLARRRGLPRRAAVIAVATAIVESTLRNVAHGDRDSLGLFQQRPSQSWGEPSDILEPISAAGKFYDALVEVPDWERLPLGVAAQTVQRSAFPERYGPQEMAAAELVSRFWDRPQGSAAAGSAGAVLRGSSPSPCPNAGSADPGSRDPGLPDPDGATLPDPAGGRPVDPLRLPDGYTPPADPVRRALISAALAHLGKPYVWGAKGPDAFDCSGLTRAAWASVGVVISAGTLNQVRDGAPVGDLAQLVPGDLLFIPGAYGTRAVPRHVGLYLGAGLVIDARSTKRGVILSSIEGWREEIVAVRRIGESAGSPW